MLYRPVEFVLDRTLLSEYRDYILADRGLALPRRAVHHAWRTKHRWTLRGSESGFGFLSEFWV